MTYYWVLSWYKKWSDGFMFFPFSQFKSSYKLASFDCTPIFMPINVRKWSEKPFHRWPKTVYIFSPFRVWNVINFHQDNRIINSHPHTVKSRVFCVVNKRLYIQIVCTQIFATFCPLNHNYPQKCVTDSVLRISFSNQQHYL